MVRESEIKERAKNAGYQVEDEGENSFTVNEPNVHWTTPHEFVIFTNCGVASIPMVASSASFERKLLKDIDYYHINIKKNKEV